MTVSVPVDGEGFLINRDDWSEEIAIELAKADEFEITDQIMGYIREARARYENDGVVPPIRKFAKELNISTKELYDIFKKGPMKLICKWGGLMLSGHRPDIFLTELPVRLRKEPRAEPIQFILNPSNFMRLSTLP